MAEGLRQSDLPTTVEGWAVMWRNTAALVVDLIEELKLHCNDTIHDRQLALLREITEAKATKANAEAQKYGRILNKWKAV